jgi:hypothetical protein
MKTTLFLWSILAAALSAAGLDFQESTKAINAPADATEIVADFPFTNKTGKAVEIKRYDAGCACMAVGVAGGKLVYQPGEAGVIRAKFDMSNYSGDVEKSIAIWLDADPESTPSVTLLVKAHIPEVIKIEPKTVKWDVGAPPSPQTIKISVEGEEKINIRSVSNSNENFTIELKTLKEGLSYELVIAPKDSSVSGLGVFRIDTDCKIERHKVKQAFASIRRALPSEAAKTQP